LAKHDPTQAFAYAKERIAQLRARKVPLLSLIIRDKLSRDLQEYTTNLPHVVAAKKLVQKGEVVGRGSTIPYVITQGKGHLYERVALIDEASLADIDVEYYVQNQVIPVVNSILEVFHLPCAELLSNVRQPSLNQFF
jgi:DNA polymerase I